MKKKINQTNNFYKILQQNSVFFGYVPSRGQN